MLLIETYWFFRLRDSIDENIVLGIRVFRNTEGPPIREIPASRPKAPKCLSVHGPRTKLEA